MVGSPVVLRRVLIVACLCCAAAVGAARSAPRSALAAPESQPADGGAVYSQNCAMCHGPAGQGTNFGPDISEVGLASVDFQLRTGRMPKNAVDSGRAKTKLDVEQIEAVIAYVSRFVTGPGIPSVDVEAASVSNGQAIYAANCAACHQSVGSGGILAHDVNVPSLRSATVIDVAEAMRTGPGQMPVFAAADFSDSDVADIAAYVQVLRDPKDRGGFGLGYLGPVPEGLVAVALGLFAMVGIARLLGTRESSDA